MLIMDIAVQKIVKLGVIVILRIQFSLSDLAIFFYEWHMPYSTRLEIFYASFLKHFKHDTMSFIRLKRTFYRFPPKENELLSHIHNNLIYFSHLDFVSNLRYEKVSISLWYKLFEMWIKWKKLITFVYHFCI